MPRQRLGDILKQAGALSEAEMERAVREQKEQTSLLGEFLLEKGLVEKGLLVDALEKLTRIPYLNCLEVDVEPEALALVTQDVATKYCCLPIAVKGRELVVVMAEPQNLGFLDDLNFITGAVLSPRLGFRSEILAAIKRHLSDFDAANPTPSVAKDLSNQQGVALDEGNAVLGKQKIEENSAGIEFISASSQQRARDAIREFQAALANRPTEAVRLVTQIIALAIQKKASDVHIDPQATETIIRLRVDGILRDIMQIQPEIANQLVSRIKILADLDIAERRLPQDGRFLVRLKSEKSDLRVATLPTHYGEKVVMRLLSLYAANASFEHLGFSYENSHALTEAITKPQGMILVCGPTGSGKSTTLYAALAKLSTRTMNIITVEDPIEYMLEGINQVQVNRKAGLTFATSLRSILRQDPNVVMVGEIRDAETAEIALTAAQTGHLVLSTLHTNDSIAAIDRLKDLGLPPFLIASSLSAIVAQRLLRKLCECRQPASVPDEILEKIPELARDSIAEKVCAPHGCEACDNTGYRGRVGVYEVLSLDDDVRRMIQDGSRADDIRKHATNNGFCAMIHDALEKIAQGQISLEEILRVVPLRKQRMANCFGCGNALQSGFVFCPQCGVRAQDRRAVAHFMEQ